VLDIYVATETGRQMRAVAMLLRASAQERPRKMEVPTPRSTNITTIMFPRINKTAMRKPANEAGLLHSIAELTVFGV
jgi:hypothetical protein